MRRQTAAPLSPDGPTELEAYLDSIGAPHVKTVGGIVLVDCPAVRKPHVGRLQGARAWVTLLVLAELAVLLMLVLIGTAMRLGGHV